MYRTNNALMLLTIFGSVISLLKIYCTFPEFAVLPPSPIKNSVTVLITSDTKFQK